MRIKLNNVEVTLEYGALKANQLTPLNIKQWYQNFRGKIEPETELEFSSKFPGEPYEKTALTSKMPSTYLCDGSISVLIRKPDSSVDVLALSVYRDTSGHDSTIGDHYNLFLQYQIDGEINHTEEIPNRHIPLQDGVIIKALVDDKEVKKAIIKQNNKQ